MAAAPQRNIYDQTATDYWLENGNYVNFDYLTIGWNIPLKKWGKYVAASAFIGFGKQSGYHYSLFRTDPMINSYIVDATLGGGRQTELSGISFLYLGINYSIFKA